MKTDCYHGTDTPARAGDLTASTAGTCRIASISYGEAELVNVLTGETDFRFVSDLDLIEAAPGIYPGMSRKDFNNAVAAEIKRRTSGGQPMLP